MGERKDCSMISLGTIWLSIWKKKIHLSDHRKEIEVTKDGNLVKESKIFKKNIGEYFYNFKGGNGCLNKP